ncbi:MAG: type IV pili twitching motility protein PilT, partial [Candidatus Omnitrophica bacterium]|nr:type IV pili twitching motility protein PilT [Candidatus Omnitrophota bacterium]
LSATVIAVVSQALLPRLDGKGRVAVFEIMIATPAIRNLIREGKTYQIVSEIQTGLKYGMKAFDDHLLELYQAGIISYDNMIETAQDPRELSNRAAKPVASEKNKKY